MLTKLLVITALFVLQVLIRQTVFYFREYSRKFKLALMLHSMILALAVVTFTRAQQRACIYTDSSLSQLVNFAHQIQKSGSCIACLPQCTTCVSQTDETCSNGNCQSQYFYDTANKQCVTCPSMCEQCSDQRTCLNCISGYFLDSNALCRPCTQGVSLCTSASILQCSLGYYYDSQTYVCRKCSDPNCGRCFGKSSCDECVRGFMLNTEGTACVSCQVTNCEFCTGVGVCGTCHRGYWLQSTSSCTKQNCSSISKCEQCENSSGTVNCTLCQPGFYLLNNTCNFGASMMCSYSLTPTFLLSSHKYFQLPMNRLVDYGSCLTCNQDIAQQAPNSQNYCVPKLVGANSSNYAHFRNEANFIFCRMPYLTTSTPSSFLHELYLIPPSYKLTLSAILIVINAQGSTSFTNFTNFFDVFALSLNLNNSLLSEQLQSYPFACSSQTVNSSTSIMKVSLSYKIETGSSDTQGSLQPLNISIGIGRTASQMGVWQIASKQVYLQVELCRTSRCVQCISASSCAKCMFPYFIQNFDCVLTCSIGYYANNVTRTCRSECEHGYFYDLASPGLQNYCVSCPLECITCTSLLVCSQCNSGYFLTVDNKCSPSCSSSPSQYYPSQTDRTCKKCQNPCQTCTIDPHNCTSCLLGFHYSSLNSGVCMLNCPIGFYPNVVVGYSQQVNPECSACDKGCLQCEMDRSQCISCKTNEYLFETICVKACPDGFLEKIGQFGDSSSCKKCAAPCNTCEMSQDNCTACQHDLYLLLRDTKGTCVSNCPSHYYKDSSSQNCILCLDPCVQCTEVNSIELCTACKAEFFLENNKCVTACRSGWMLGNICKDCPYPCSTCNAINASYICNTCVQGYYLQVNVGVCVLVCPVGSYGDWQKQICATCPTQCTQCTISINQTAVDCIECSTSYFLVNRTCLSKCPIGYFNLSTRCEPCSLECLECSNVQNLCTKCQANKYLLPKSGECFDSCPHSYFHLNMLCLECSPECSECSSAPSNCTVCSASYYQYYNTTLQQLTCISFEKCSKIVGSFPNTQTNGCEPCRLPCLQCKSLSFCTACDSNNFLLRNICVSQCPSTFYQADSQCQPCPSMCITCLSSEECLTCKPNFYLSSSLSQCLQQCPVGEFRNTGSMICELCKFPCLTCDNREYCRSCSTILIGDISVSLILLEGRCLTPCPDGFFTQNISNNQQCLKCSKQCETCLSHTSCSTCNFGYFHHNQSCLHPTQCPVQFFPDLNTRACSPCQAPCLTCKSRYECSTCLLGYSLKESSCYISCPIGTYPQNSTCIQCPHACSRCSDARHCLECSNGTFILSDQTANTSICSQICPEGTYLDLSQSTCSICSADCRTCSRRSNNCTSCAQNQVLQNGKCIDSCSSFYFERSLAQINQTHRYCSMCNQSCSKCIDQNVCIVCDSAFLVTTSTPLNVNSNVYYASYCTSHCPLATFRDSQKFMCLPCSPGCLNCKSYQNCLQCSRNQGFVLFNTNCIPLPCPSHLYRVIDDNKCVQKSYCEGKPEVFSIFEKDKQCFRKLESGCPKQLVLKDEMFCVQSCPEGYSVDFSKACVHTSKKGEKFTTYSIVKEGYIMIVIRLNAVTKPNWINLFTNVTVSSGINWEQKQSRRLLSSELAFRNIQPTQKYSNALILEIAAEEQIVEPIDLTIRVSMSSPYTPEISLNYLPLQNWQSVTMIKSYMVTSEQLGFYQHHQSHYSAPAIILIILLLAVSTLNLTMSGKIYLLIPSWDFMQTLYFLPYFNMYWPAQVRGFFSTFLVLNLKWFDIERSSLTPSPERVHSYAIDINWVSNSLCCIILICVGLLGVAIQMLIRKVTSNVSAKKQDGSKTENVESIKYRVQNSQIPKKLLCALCYLATPNLLYFSLLNLFYRSEWTQTNAAVICVSVCIIALVVWGIIYCFVRQIREKTLLDSGINSLKKSIIVSFPIYLVVRKLFAIVFLALFPDDPAFPLCFGLITTVFMVILAYWFEPYNNQIRQRLFILHQLAIFLFFLCSTVYATNQSDLMQGGFAVFLLVLAILVSILALLYPLYHLYILTNLPAIFLSSTQSHPGYCIEDQCEFSKIDRDLTIGVGRNLCQNQIGTIQSSIKDLQVKKKKGQSTEKPQKKKKKKVKLPKDRLISNQTDHEADQSSQEGEKTKMKLANYTVRLTKKDPPFVNNFKNYDLNANQSSNDADGLAEKQIQLSRLLEKQKNLVRNKEKILTDHQAKTCLNQI